ncbi:MAG: tannase/feruloyl esterase family alpha/beta hydrolase [Steroidobacteraceae bacterium]
MLKAGLSSSLPTALILVFSACAADTATQQCSDLLRLQLADTKLTTAEMTAPGFKPPVASFDFVSKDVVVQAPFCRVSGTIAPSIQFEVWLPPPAAWNGKLHGVGNGGMAGSIHYAGLNGAVEAGYVTVSSDLGHQGGPVAGDWAIGQPELVRDWGHRATHEMTVKAKEIARAYYGRPATRAYFSGCSGGGRQGMMQAQRYPDDYDGILLGDPTMDFSRLVVGGRLWQVRANLASEATNLLGPRDVATISAAVNEQCDALDGIRDGVIEDPRRCRFDPKRIECKGGSHENCLTTQQAQALLKIYQGARTKAGVRIYPGYEPGGELGKFGWIMYFAGESPQKGMQWPYAEGFLRGLVFEEAKYDILKFDYDTDVEEMVRKLVLGEPLASVIDAANPDLSRFKAHGGKLIHYHGWTDAGVAPQRSIDYYEEVVRTMAAADKKNAQSVQDFYRLFMAPGMQHCFGGPGPNAFGAPFQPPVPDDAEHSLFRALERWVERGVAPADVVATKYVDDDPGRGVMRTRKICAYPKAAAYKGSGSTDAAASFECREPTK